METFKKFCRTFFGTLLGVGLFVGLTAATLILSNIGSQEVAGTTWDKFQIFGYMGNTFMLILGIMITFSLSNIRWTDTLVFFLVYFVFAAFFGWFITRLSGITCGFIPLFGVGSCVMACLMFLAVILVLIIFCGGFFVTVYVLELKSYPKKERFKMLANDLAKPLGFILAIVILIVTIASLAHL